ncbi:ABC transporter permease [Nocardioides sp. SYSU DS0651]|uniref:ABC transporter permease n=1 Tax=Nocardioides sp. SYSU DS0651 TaxID=3415955 RepID=UPI003F4C54C1
MTTAPTAPPPTLDVSGTPPTPFHRLVRVEWRKMLDTRGGFWLLASTAILIALTMAVLILIVALNDSVIEFDAGILAQIFTYPISLLVPVFGVLIVTSEWSQRTAMVTFALEPKRVKVVAAKLVAVALLAVATLALAVVIGSFTNLLVAAIDGYDPVWDLAAGRFFWILMVQLAFFAMGFALGTLLLNTPGAIAVYYVVALMLPLILWPILFAVFDWARDILPWVEINTASAPLTAGTNYLGEEVEVGAKEYLQFFTSSLLWVGLPLALGIARLLRAEVK